MAVDGAKGPGGDAGAVQELPTEDSIRVVCRFRPLNDTEERTGSKFIVKFPSGTEDQCVSIGVSPVSFNLFMGINIGRWEEH